LAINELGSVSPIRMLTYAILRICPAIERFRLMDRA